MKRRAEGQSSLPYILSFLCPPSVPGFLLARIQPSAPISQYMRHLPHNTHYAEKFGVIHGDCAEAGAPFTLAAELKLVAGAGVEQGFVFLVAVRVRFNRTLVPEVPVSIGPTVWATVGPILRFKMLMHWLPPSKMKREVRLSGDQIVAGHFRHFLRPRGLFIRLVSRQVYDERPVVGGHPTRCTATV